MPDTSVMNENTTQPEIPYGYCHCGCGERTPIAPCNSYTQGYVKGTPRDYITGHNAKRTPYDYLEEDRGYKTPCWIWQRHITKRSGHGQLKRGSRSMYAHLWYWEREHGSKPRGMDLHHLCEIPACCNPDHLELVTRLEHIQTHSPLTEDDVREIRHRYAQGERQADIGADYGFTQAYISLICTRKQWANVA